MKKRILSILLTLCMVLMLVPATVFAEGGTTPTYDLWQVDGKVYYAEAGTRTDFSTADGGVELPDWSNPVCYQFPSSGTYVLQTNITLTSSRQMIQFTTPDTTLELNGKTVTSYHGSFSYVSADNTTIQDSNGGGTINGDLSIWGSLTLKNGTINGELSIIGSLTLKSGTITVINNVGNGTFYADGGTVTDNLINKGTVTQHPEVEGTKIECIAYNRDGGIIDGGIFYGKVVNVGGFLPGTISSGVFYGGIEDNGGTITGTTYTVSFDLNGASGTAPVTQYFVNTNTAKALEPDDPTREGYEFAGWYNGETKYDFTQNVTEDITLTAKWESVEAPVITGLEDGKTYCDAVEFEVADNVGVTSVTAGGVELSPTNGKYTLEKGIGTVTVVAIDKANNQTSVTVTVNNGHTGGTATCTQKAKCGICGEEYGELANHSLSKTDAKEATCTEDGNIEYWTCSVCHKLFSDENGTNETTFEAVTVNATDHPLTKTEASAATVTATGNKEYWHCKDCGKYFADENGTKEIKLEDTIISKLSPEIIEGKGQSITAGEKKELTFKSNAAFSDFIRVELDGKTLDEKNYTVKEGSTIVTLKADYVATLSAGEHTIGIVSESGTASTTFTVNAKTVVDDDTKSPQTGDNSHMALWIMILFVSGAGVIGTTVYGKKKRSAK